MGSSWVYLTLGVVVALIALGAVAINTALDQAAKPKMRIIPVKVQEVSCSSIYSSALPILTPSSSNSSSPLRLAFFMQSDSTMQICIKYTSNLPNKGLFPVQVKGENPISRNLFPFEPAQDVTVTAKPHFVSLSKGSETLVEYTITANSTAKGVYWLSIDQLCDSIPIVVGLGISEVSSTDFPVIMGFHSCPAIFLDAQIVGSSDAEISYVPTKPVGNSS